MSKKKQQQQTHYLWCLYNRLNDQLIEAVSYNEVRAICLVLPKEQRVNWHAWREGWDEWKPVPDCLELFMPASQARRPLSPPGPPESTRWRTIKKEMVTPEKTDKEIIPRKNHRVQVRYGIEIISNNQSFCTFSCDVSLGGIRLEAPVPEWVAGYCTLIISDTSGNKLEFVATIVENQNLADKTRLELQSSASLAILEQWLVEHAADGPSKKQSA